MKFKYNIPSLSLRNLIISAGITEPTISTHAFIKIEIPVVIYRDDILVDHSSGLSDLFRFCCLNHWLNVIYF